MILMIYDFGGWWLVLVEVEGGEMKRAGGRRLKGGELPIPIAIMMF